jgi:Rha family phage regulatory protein
MWFAEVVTPQSTEEIAVQNEIALVQQNNQAFVLSREIAAKFGKLHSNVIRDIKNLTFQNRDNAEFKKFFSLNFEEQRISLDNCLRRGRRPEPHYKITRDGFVFLAMGFTGRKATDWKVRFLDAFNEMEKVIIQQIPALQAENAALKAALGKKALPGRRANQIAVPVYHENLFGLVEEIRYEMRNKEKLDELMQAKAVVRHLRKQMKGMIAKQDQLAERIDLLEGNKKAKLIKLIKDDPEKPL